MKAYKSILKTASIAVTAALTGILLNLFYTPHGFVPAGVTGIAAILHYLFGWKIGITTFLMNIPIYLYAVFQRQGKLVFFSLVGTVFFSIGYDLPLPMLQLSDPLIAALFGGVINGFCFSVIVRCGATTGGIDIIGVILERKYAFSAGFITLVINLGVLLAAGAVLGAELALLTLLAKFTASKAYDFGMSDLNRTKTVLLLTERPEEIAAAIYYRLNRSSTFLIGEGAYLRQPIKILYCVVRTTDIPVVRELAKNLDPNSMLSEIDTQKVMGKGFHSL